MPKTDGDITKQRILNVSEKLFSEKGFNGTSVGSIAKAIGINKATIYYHFKDKQDIIISLFKNIVNEIEDSIKVSLRSKENTEIKEKITNELKFLLSKKKILTVMFMEALRDSEVNTALFECSKIVIDHEFHGQLHELENIDGTKRDLFYIHEFFTGFVPLITFIVMGDKWCTFFDCNKDSFFENFMDAFNRSHLTSHTLKR
jgi:AcrR family transcriptional regulator